MEFQHIHGRIGSDIWANTRARILKNLIKGKGKLILDLGCGKGYIGKLFERENKVIYADIDEKEMEDIRGMKMVLDARYLPFKDSSFDYILCADVLEHIENDDEVLREIYRVLKKKGRAIIAVPAYSKFYGHHDKLIGHHRRYDKKDIENKAKKLNYKIILQRYICSLLFFPFLINQFFIKSNKIYKGKSKIENKFDSILNLICSIESSVNMPFGIGLLAVLEK